jgi:hypothetical protein
MTWVAIRGGVVVAKEPTAEEAIKAANRLGHTTGVTVAEVKEDPAQTFWNDLISDLAGNAEFAEEFWNQWGTCMVCGAPQGKPCTPTKGSDYTPGWVLHRGSRMLVPHVAEDDDSDSDDSNLISSHIRDEVSITEEATHESPPVPTSPHSTTDKVDHHHHGQPPVKGGADDAMQHEEYEGIGSAWVFRPLDGNHHWTPTNDAQRQLVSEFAAGISVADIVERERESADDAASPEVENHERTS